MIGYRPFSLFVSSKITELSDERSAVKAALQRYNMFSWIWENDAGASSEPTRSTYLTALDTCDVYIGLFWLGYGPYTVEEFEYARKKQKPCLLYRKEINADQRDARLKQFLIDLQDPKNPDGLTICPFLTPKQLAKCIQEDVIKLLIGAFRRDQQHSFLMKQEQDKQMLLPSISDKNVIVNINVNIYQNNNTPLKDE